MPDEVISVHARLYAERLMRGDPVSESEMHVIIAGLMLSVDKLVNAINRIDNSLWTEARLCEIIGEEVSEHCLSQQKACLLQQKACKPESGFWASWLGRVLRGFAGMKCLLMAVCLCAGCATWQVRVNDPVGGIPIYPASCLDVGGAALCCIEFGWEAGFIAIPIALVDLPFSLVSDTVFLPYDLIVYTKN